MTEAPFYARLSDLGRRHPVTRGLEGGAEDPPHWSRWFRLVDTKSPSGSTLMQGPDDKPLLLLARQEEGRVALCSCPITSGCGRAATKAAVPISTSCAACRTG